ncbi:MAG: hypothetical protein AAGI51_07840, partial [Pseudomonadota bacterium]
VARNGLRRPYEPAVLEELALISLAKSAGFALEEIGLVMRALGPATIPCKALVRRADDLGLQAERLKSLAKTMLHEANCDHADHFDCPRFRKLLKVDTRVTGERNAKPSFKGAAFMTAFCARRWWTSPDAVPGPPEID